jgi:hypothetical protein
MKGKRGFLEWLSEMLEEHERMNEKAIGLIFFVTAIIGYLALAIVLPIYSPPESRVLSMFIAIIILSVLIMLLFARGASSKNKIISFLNRFLYYAVPFIFFFFASVYETYGLIKGNTKTHIYDFMQSLYFSAVTLTKLGYSDLHPTEYSKFYAGLESLLGYFLIALFVGFVIAYFHQKAKGRQGANEK